MTVTQPPPAGCPPGLEYLTAIDELIVKQQIELLEGRVFLSPNGYVIQVPVCYTEQFSRKVISLTTSVTIM